MKIRGRRTSEKGRTRLVVELRVHLKEVTTQKKIASALVCMINSDAGRLKQTVQQNLITSHPIGQEEAEARGGVWEEKFEGRGTQQIMSGEVLRP